MLRKTKPSVTIFIDTLLRSEMKGVCWNLKKWLNILNRIFSLLIKSCTVYLNSIFLVEMEFVYKRFQKWDLLHLPLRNFKIDLISLSVKSDQQNVIYIKYLSLNFNNMPSFISLLLKFSKKIKKCLVKPSVTKKGLLKYAYIY